MRKRDKNEAWSGNLSDIYASTLSSYCLNKAVLLGFDSDKEKNALPETYFEDQIKWARLAQSDEIVEHSYSVWLKRNGDIKLLIVYLDSRSLSSQLNMSKIFYLSKAQYYFPGWIDDIQFKYSPQAKAQKSKQKAELVYEQQLSPSIATVRLSEDLEREIDLILDPLRLESIEMYEAAKRAMMAQYKRDILNKSY